MKRWGEKRYYSLNFFIKETFGEKLYKIALDGGMTRPNRDGTLEPEDAFSAAPEAPVILPVTVIFP